MGEISAIICPASGKPYLKTIKNELETLQELVGGYIEADPIVKGVVAIVNEHGIELGLPVNRSLKGMFFLGTVVLVGHDFGTDDFRSLMTYDLGRLDTAGLLSIKDIGTDPREGDDGRSNF